jgi:hypothetical protein
MIKEASPTIVDDAFVFPLYTRFHEFASRNFFKFFKSFFSLS